MNEPTEQVETPHEDVDVPDYYTNDGIIKAGEAKEEEKRAAMVKALMALFNRIPREAADGIYYVEFEPVKTTAYRGRFRLGSQWSSEWVDFAERVALGRHKKWNTDGTPKQ